MATIDFVEKDIFISLVEEYNGSGYVCDFSNRTFQEFIYEIIHIDIYNKYPNLSKGKILRAIMNDYDNITVGKLILEILGYMQAKQMITFKNEDKFKKCAETGNRLIGKKVKVNTVKEKPITPIESTVDYDYWLKELTKLSSFNDTPQARGYAFEKLLKDIFEIFDLKPRGSFKIFGNK